jgi:hypothetical protein
MGLGSVVVQALWALSNLATSQPALVMGAALLEPLLHFLRGGQVSPILVALCFDQR